MGNNSSRIAPQPQPTLADAQTNTDFSNYRDVLEERISLLQDELSATKRQLRDNSSSNENDIDKRQGKIVALKDKLKRQKIVSSAKLYHLERELAGIMIQMIMKKTLKLFKQMSE
jgi:hypothetical protein